MENLKDFLKFFENDNLKLESLKKKSSDFAVYPNSIRKHGKAVFFMTKIEGLKKLVIINPDSLKQQFSGEIFYTGNVKYKLCPLNHENCVQLRKLFDFAVPSSVLRNKKTIGLGDRLGVATAGHIRLIKEYDVFPIFAQQSIRELNLTGRTYTDVLDDVSWAVFQEGYTKGFGADGDHLKKHEEVEMALNEGFTMITLDCSEYINNDAAKISDAEIHEIYVKKTDKDYIEKYYNKEFKLAKGTVITFSKEEIERIAVIYGEAIKFAKEIYDSHIRNCERKVDFEVSIDETLTSTTPQAHFFVASELKEAGVSAVTIAPRFCGEFQKGIDYIGDKEQFTQEFKIHAEIADTFGYKISIHSGSDKFSVFPIIGELSGGRYHLKTAGTNWLEAIRVIARRSPQLFRNMYAYAVEVLDEAKKYYHIKGDPSNVKSLQEMEDEELESLMDQDDARQIMHITYGLLLNAKNEKGKFLFREQFFETLNKYEDDYYKALYKHIGKHLKKLGEQEDK